MSLFRNISLNHELQWLYKNYGEINYENNRWNQNYQLNMKIVDLTLSSNLNHDMDIWVEKCPPTICRAVLYQDYFEKNAQVYFIVSIRNPYSSRNNINTWIKFAKYQKFNLENLKNTIYISYELLCSNLDSVISKINREIPGLELRNIYINEKNTCINEKNSVIHNNKIDRILDKESKNLILKDNIKLLHYFNYNYID